MELSELFDTMELQHLRFTLQDLSLALVQYFLAMFPCLSFGIVKYTIKRLPGIAEETLDFSTLLLCSIPLLMEDCGEVWNWSKCILHHGMVVSP